MTRTLFRPSAILLLGPTGSGKTPLGNALEQHGLWNRRCAHFDFGQELRRVARLAPGSAPLSQAQHSVVVRALREGLLLEDHHFPIARALLLAFTGAHRLQERDLVVLNGLPRHPGQARDLDSAVDVQLVAFLQSDPETVAARIGLNTGGDRENRTDDTAALIQRKVTVFRQRTLPLLAHYREKGARTVTMRVTVTTTAADLLCQLAEDRPI